ncbi:MAG: DMT family transporter [Archangium sp.]
MSKHQPSGVAIIAASSLFFGVMAVTTRLLAGKVPAAEIAAVRFAIGIVACAIWFIARRQKPNLGRWRLLAMRGTFGGIAVVTYFFAIQRLGAAAATVLNYSSPIYAAVFAAWFLGERSTWVKRLGLVFATAGAVLVTLSSAPEGQHWSAVDLGALAGVISAIAGGAAMTSMRKLRDDTDAASIFFAFCVVGFVLSAPLAAPQWVPLEGNTVWICLAVGVLSIIGQMLFTYGMGFTSATAGSATTQLVPVVAWVLSLGMLHEAVTMLGVLGALLCVGGVLIGVVNANANANANARTTSQSPTLTPPENA